MTAAEISSWHAVLLATVVVLIANALIGFCRPAAKNGRIAFVQGCTATILIMLPEITSDTPDGQAGIGIPFFLILFFGAAWVGLAIGGSLAQRISQRSSLRTSPYPLNLPESRRSASQHVATFDAYMGTLGAAGSLTPNSGR